jgi:hypothetical protein
VFGGGGGTTIIRTGFVNARSFSIALRASTASDFLDLVPSDSKSLKAVVMFGARPTCTARYARAVSGGVTFTIILHKKNS